MFITVAGLGFSRKYSVPSGCTLRNLKEKLEENFDVFYRNGEPISDDTILNENDTIIAMRSEQKISLG